MITIQLIILIVYRSSKVKVIKSDKNGGYSYINNIGIKFCIEKLESEYIVISNPDVSFSEETLFNIISFYKNNRKLGAVSPTIKDIDGGKSKVCTWKSPVGRMIQSYLA